MNNIENINIENRVEVAKTNKVTSAKMLKSTKDLIDELNLEGNQQEKLDALVKGYKVYLEEAQGIAKEEVEEFDLSGELCSITKALEGFVKIIESKVTNHISDAIAINVSNAEKDFSVKHSEFMKYLSEIKEHAISTQLESKEKAREIEEFISKINELNKKIEELNKEKAELEKKNSESIKNEQAYSNLLEKVKGEKDSISIKLESKKSLLDEETAKNYRLNTTVNEYKMQISRLNQDIKDKEKDVKVANENNNKLEVRNRELEVNLAELKTKNSSLLEENKEMNIIKKEMFEKTEEVVQLEKRNKVLENDLKEFNVLKVKNIELEGTANALKTQNKALSGTLNTINSTIDAIVKSRDEAEKKASSAENEIQKLLLRIKELEESK